MSYGFFIKVFYFFSSRRIRLRNLVSSILFSTLFFFSSFATSNIQLAENNFIYNQREFSNYLSMGRQVGSIDGEKKSQNKVKSNNSSKNNQINKNTTENIYYGEDTTLISALNNLGIDINDTNTSESISNQYLTFTGSIKRRGKVYVFLQFNTLANQTVVNGFYVDSRRFLTKPLIGNILNTNSSSVDISKMTLYELIKKGSKWYTNNTITLIKKNKYWIGDSNKFVMRFSLYDTKLSQNFNYRGKYINPQSIAILLEKVQGYTLAVDLRTRNDRSFRTKNNWQRVNLEYGYIRYRILGQQNNVWILATELDKGDGQSRQTKIIKVIRIGNVLALAKIIDSDKLPSSLLSEDSFQVQKEKVLYQKKLSEKGILAWLQELNQDRQIIQLNDVDVNRIAKNINDKINTNLCESCAQVVVHYNYEITKDLLSPVLVELKGGQEISATENNYFNDFIQEESKKNSRIVTLEELKSFFTSWIENHVNLP